MSRPPRHVPFASPAVRRRGPMGGAVVLTVVVALGLGVTAASRCATTAARSAERAGIRSVNAPSPGGLLAFASYDRGEHIVAMRPDGTGMRVLVRNAREPVWSPNGRWLAYTRVPGRSGFTTIMRARSNGTQAHVVSRWARDDPTHPYFVEHPSWSPDGRRIVFNALYQKLDARGRPRYDDEGEAIGERGVFVARAAGSKPRRLRDAPSNTSVGPAWAPDGRNVAAVIGHRIALIPVKGGSPRTLARVDTSVGRLAFAPSGRRLLASDAHTILTFDLRTGGRTTIPAAAGELLSAAAWTPDGKRIAYLAQLGWTPVGGVPPGSPTALFSMRPNGTAKRQLAILPIYALTDTLSWKR
jgi:Tol biopolymer transport system component